MSRPPSVSAASWIWLFCALFTTFSIANVLTATNILALFTGLSLGEDGPLAAEVISGFGWALTSVLLVAMVGQVVAAVKLRDGARWARILLTVAAAISLVTVLYDLTIWTAWVLLAANVVAVGLAWGETASDYLAGHPRQAVPARRAAV